MSAATKHAQRAGRLYPKAAPTTLMIYPKLRCLTGSIAQQLLGFQAAAWSAPLSSWTAGPWQTASWRRPWHRLEEEEQTRSQSGPASGLV